LLSKIIYNSLTLDSDNNVLLLCLQLVEAVVKELRGQNIIDFFLFEMFFLFFFFLKLLLLLLFLLELELFHKFVLLFLFSGTFPLLLQLFSSFLLLLFLEFFTAMYLFLLIRFVIGKDKLNGFDVIRYNHSWKSRVKNFGEILLFIQSGDN